MKSCGIVLGTIFLAFFAYLSDYSLSLLHKSSQMLIEDRKDQKCGILRERVRRGALLNRTLTDARSAGGAGTSERETMRILRRPSTDTGWPLS
jgi:hypothetical protein